MLIRFHLFSIWSCLSFAGYWKFAKTHRAVSHREICRSNGWKTKFSHQWPEFIIWSCRQRHLGQSSSSNFRWSVHEIWQCPIRMHMFHMFADLFRYRHYLPSRRRWEAIRDLPPLTISYGDSNGSRICFRRASPQGADRHIGRLKSSSPPGYLEIIRESQMDCRGVNP
jgi:hypothetical protein